MDGSGEGSKLTAIPETGEEKGMAETEGSSDQQKKDEGGGTPPPPVAASVKPEAAKTVTWRGGATTAGSNNNPAHETPMMFRKDMFEKVFFLSITDMQTDGRRGEAIFIGRLCFWMKGKF